MPFTPQEKELIQLGADKGKTNAEIESALKAFRAGTPVRKAVPQLAGQFIDSPFKGGAPQSTFSKIGSSFGRAFETGREEITEQVQEGGERFADVPDTALGTLVEKPAILLNTLFRATGTTAKTAFTPFAEGLVVGIEKTAEAISNMPEVQRYAQNPFVSGALDSVVGGLESAGEDFEEWKAENPELAKDVEAGTEILLTVLGEKATTEIVSSTLRVARESLQTTKEVVGKIKLPTLPDVKLPKVELPKEGFLNTLKEKVGATQERVATNVATKKATEEAIQALPTETSKTAVRQGIDINDVTEVQKFFVDPITAQTDKVLFRELADTAKAFSESGQRGTNPIEVVGKPIVERFKTLEAERAKIGAELGKTADNLGQVTTTELAPVILAKLQEVSGLTELRLTKGGVLDFSNTSLATTLSKADQKAIQQAFTEAIRGGGGKQKHLLRQELFEIIGGKKLSQTPITGTQERAFNAIRQGLSEILESKNNSYKTLSNEYRRVINPLILARKLLKENAIAGESGANLDLLELRAGILMRRLTGSGSSGPEIEALLRELDVVGRTLGEGAVNTRNLQEFYNILNKYYDLAPSTSFQGQIRGALELKGGFVDRVMRGLAETTGETTAVRQKALQDLLDEVLGSVN